MQLIAKHIGQLCGLKAYKMRISIVILSLFMFSAIQAGTFKHNSQSAVQNGMANAGVAAPINASSIYYNPGSLVFTKRAVILGITPRIDRTAFLEESTNDSYTQTDKSFAYPIHFYGSWGKKEGNWKIGLSYNSPYVTKNVWEDNWAGRFVTQSFTFETMAIQPTFSYKIKDKLGIGLGIQLMQNTTNYNRKLPINNTSGGFAELDVTTKAYGYSFNAGIFYAVNDLVSLGLNYKSPITFNTTEGSYTTDAASLYSSDFPVTAVSNKWVMPHNFTLGLAYRANQKFTLALDVGYTTWSSIDSVNYDFATNTDYLEDIVEARNFKNTFSLAIGGDIEVSDAVSLRAGLSYEVATVQDGFIAPDMPNNDRLGLGFGFSVMPANGFFIEASLLYTEEAKLRELKGENLYRFGGTYKYTSLTPAIGLTYKFE